MTVEGSPLARKIRSKGETFPFQDLSRPFEPTPTEDRIPSPDRVDRYVPLGTPDRRPLPLLSMCVPLFLPLSLLSPSLFSFLSSLPFRLSLCLPLCVSLPLFLSLCVSLSLLVSSLSPPPPPSVVGEEGWERTPESTLSLPRHDPFSGGRPSSLTTYILTMK